MTSDLIKKLKYADAWAENDICCMLAQCNPDIGNTGFFEELLKTAKKANTLKVINKNDIVAYSLSRIQNGSKPEPLFLNEDVINWCETRGFLLPTSLMISRSPLKGSEDEVCNHETRKNTFSEKTLLLIISALLQIIGRISKKELTATQMTQGVICDKIINEKTPGLSESNITKVFAAANRMMREN